MHSIPASTFFLSAESGGTRASSSCLVLLPPKLPFARAHLSKNSRMSVTRSRITGRLRRGAITRLFSRETLSTWVRQVQRGTPFTVIAHEPHMPTGAGERETGGGGESEW